MFERFSEKTRRAILLARSCATENQDSHIRCVHLLSGIEREAREIVAEAGLTRERLQQLSASPELAQRGAYSTSASAEVPLDENARRALILAAEAAEAWKALWVQPAHLFWAAFQADGKLREKLLEEKLTEEKMSQICRKYSQAEEDTESAALRLAAQLAEASRSGIGYDLHRLAQGRKLILGGIEVPFEKGPVGHSDGDVLSHAICDALLGAAGLGDIGTHFPDTEPRWKGVSSLVFLEHVRTLLSERSLRIRHIDAVVIAERPKLGSHFPAMREALANALGIAPKQINLKAKTHEGIGEIGRGEAISAQAIATLEG